MTWNIILQIILFGIALSMDAFAVSVTDGLIYVDINKKKSFFIAGTFGLMQALMPLIGYWIIEITTTVIGDAGGEQVGHILGEIVTWAAFGLLLFIGGKMLIEALLSIKKPVEEKEPKKFSYKEVLLMGIATAIDALATGVAFNNHDVNGNSLSTNYTIWLHVTIIMCCTFIISLIGVLLANKIQKVFKGKYEITGIIGGSILILLAVWIVLSHYFNLGL